MNLSQIKTCQSATAYAGALASLECSFMPQSLLASRLLALLDLTSLGEDDSPIRIRALCASARTPHGQPAAVCVYPEHVTSAREALAGTPIKIASVVNFPEGGDDPQRVYRETRRAVAAGADEIDMVLAWRALRAGDTARAKAGVEACRQPAEPASP